MDSSSEDEFQVGGSENCIELLDERHDDIPRFSLSSTTYTFKIKDVPNNRSIPEFLESAFHQVYSRVKSLSSNNTDRIIFNFRSENMSTDSFTNLTPIHDFTFDRLWTIISSICQSAGGIDATSAFNIKVIILKRIVGGCSMPKSERSKHGTLLINNKDNLCLPRSIVVKITELETNKLDAAKIKAVRDSRRELQKNLTLEFINKSGVIVPPEGCGLEQVRQFQLYLATCTIKRVIKIYKYDANNINGHEIIFDGTNLVPGFICDEKNYIPIAYYENSKHYEPINNIITFMHGTKKYCLICDKRYSSPETHLSCPGRCDRCLTNLCSKDVDLIDCLDCGRSFYGEQCLNKHRAPQSYNSKHSVCGAIKKCQKCFKKITLNTNHLCGYYYCSACEDLQPPSHLCYFKSKMNFKKKEDLCGYVFYDFETMQCEIINNDNKIYKIHEVNYVVSHLVCDKCMNDTKVEEL